MINDPKISIKKLDYIAFSFVEFRNIFVYEVMNSVKDFSYLWSDDSDNSALNISNLDSYQGSLMLYVLRDLKYTQTLKPKDYKFDFFEIIVDEDTLLKQLNFPAEVFDF